jgi:hypothetical protein
MEAVIKVRADELQQDLLEKIKLLIGDNNSVEIIIQVRDTSFNSSQETPAEYLSQLQYSIGDKKAGKTTEFSMEEFRQYVNENFSQ